MDEKTYMESLAKLFGKAPADVTLGTTIKEDLGATSQMLFGVCAMTEQLSGKPLSYAAVNNCTTVGDILALLK